MWLSTSSSTAQALPECRTKAPARSTTRRPDNGRVRRWPYVEASANDCTMRVVELAWNGWNRDVLTVVAPLASHQYFAYQGTLYESYPYVRAAIMSLFDRVRARGLYARKPSRARRARTPIDVHRPAVGT